MKVNGFDGSKHDVCPMCGWFTDPGKACGECGYVEDGDEDVSGWRPLLDEDEDDDDV
jgi:hypothetical protein